MKKVLLKIAHWILTKYKVIPLERRDAFSYEGTEYIIFAVDTRIELGCPKEIKIHALSKGGLI